MTTIEPTYISFEQAKWLKEKGFFVYGYLYDVWLGNTYKRKGKKTIEIPVYGLGSTSKLPEQWLVVEWLRVNHGILVVVNLDSVHLKGIMYFANIIKFGKHHKSKHKTIFYNTPQEAYSVAFDYIKDNNLI